MKEQSITVDIRNNPEVLRLIVDTIPYMDGWILNANITFNVKTPFVWKNYPNHTPRFIKFKLNNKEATWAYEDDSAKGGEPVIDSIFKMSKVLDHIYLQSLTLRPEK